MGRKTRGGTPGLRKDPRSGIWQIDKVVLGIRICESTGTRNQHEAELILARRIDELVEAVDRLNEATEQRVTLLRVVA